MSSIKTGFLLLQVSLAGLSGSVCDNCENLDWIDLCCEIGKERSKKDKKEIAWDRFTLKNKIVAKKKAYKVYKHAKCLFSFNKSLGKHESCLFKGVDQWKYRCSKKTFKNRLAYENKYISYENLKKHCAERKLLSGIKGLDIKEIAWYNQLWEKHKVIKNWYKIYLFLVKYNLKQAEVDLWRKKIDVNEENIYENFKLFVCEIAQKSGIENTKPFLEMFYAPINFLMQCNQYAHIKKDNVFKSLIKELFEGECKFVLLLDYDNNYSELKFSSSSCMHYSDIMNHLKEYFFCDFSIRDRDVFIYYQNRIDCIEKEDIVNFLINFGELIKVEKNKQKLFYIISSILDNIEYSCGCCFSQICEKCSRILVLFDYIFEDNDMSALKEKCMYSSDRFCIFLQKWNDQKRIEEQEILKEQKKIEKQKTIEEISKNIDNIFIKENNNSIDNVKMLLKYIFERYQCSENDKLCSSQTCFLCQKINILLLHFLHLLEIENKKIFCEQYLFVSKLIKEERFACSSVLEDRIQQLEIKYNSIIKDKKIISNMHWDILSQYL